MKKAAIIIISIFNVSLYSQQVTKVGTTAARFLEINVSARACGMGSAFVALADDASGVYWNPAGLGYINNIEAEYSSADWLADTDIRFLSLSVYINKFGTLNLSGTFLNMEEIVRTTINDPNGKGESFEAGSKALGLSYANNMLDNISLGITLKYIEEKIYSSHADGYAIDVGAIYSLPINSLKFGISYSNYGSKMIMSGNEMLTQIDIDPLISGNNSNINANLQANEFDLPSILRFGFAFDVLEGIDKFDLNIALDGVNPKEEELFFNFGGELVYNNMIFLRKGFIDFFEKYDTTWESWGYGLRINIDNLFALKYNYSNQETYFDDEINFNSFGLEILF